jgi:hypothetical protein
MPLIAAHDADGVDARVKHLGQRPKAPKQQPQRGFELGHSDTATTTHDSGVPVHEKTGEPVLGLEALNLKSALHAHVKIKNIRTCENNNKRSK